MTTNNPDGKKPKFWTLARRRWAYGVLAAAGVLALAYGITTTEQLAAWLTLGGALLGVTSLAAAHPKHDE